jgi:hypothetical protein
MEGEMLGLLSLAIVAAVALVACSEAPDNGGRNYSPPASARLSGSEKPNRSGAWHPCGNARIRPNREPHHSRTSRADVGFYASD